jgi:prepilin-type N-terminal cleavage/methylation domain-containing protein
MHVAKIPISTSPYANHKNMIGQPGSVRINGEENGFTMLELLITLTIISVVTVMAVLGITKARASMRLSNSTRQFAFYSWDLFRGTLIATWQFMRIRSRSELGRFGMHLMQIYAKFCAFS